jgi:hypothetical protein
VGFTENSPTFEIVKALIETHKKHKKNGLKANDKQPKWKNPKGYERRKQTWRERKKEKFESMEKVGLQRNLASHLGLRSQCQRKKDEAAFGVERSKQRKLDMELDTELKIKQNLEVGDGAHIILSFSSSIRRSWRSRLVMRSWRWRS